VIGYLKGKSVINIARNYFGRTKYRGEKYCNRDALFQLLVDMKLLFENI